MSKVDRDGQGCPYKAPSAFAANDAPVFFGRQRELTEVIALLEAARSGPRQRYASTVVLVGAEGVGKTSFIRAALEPRLAQCPEWVLSPPSGGGSGQGTQLLVADLDAGPADSARAHTLVETAPRDAVLLLSATPEQFDAVASVHPAVQRYDLPPLPAFRLDEVITGPAAHCGVAVEAALVDDIIDDALTHDAAPAVGFALVVLWSTRRDATLTSASYRAMGRLRGIVESACEQALRGDAALGDPAEAALDALGTRVFVPALVRLDRGRLVRGRASRGELDDDARAVVDRFVQSGLVTIDPSTDTVTVTHEAIFRLWFRVDGWLASTRDRHEALLRLKSAAGWWHRDGRSPRHVKTASIDHLDDFDADPLLPFEQDFLRCLRERQVRLRAKRRARMRWAIATAVAAAWLLLVLTQRTWLMRQWRRTFPPAAPPQFEGYVLTERQERDLRPGDVFRECDGRCPEMVVVPAGQFMMGDELGQDRTLLPRRLVTIDRPFAVSRTEITIDHIVAQHQSVGWPVAEEMWASDRRRPTNDVMHDSARSYVRWLSKKTGRRYRLLSSAEWEYVARAGTQTAFWWGDEVEAGRMHCQEGCGSPFVGGEVLFATGKWLQSAPVGSFAPNPFGLYDVHGNVWEIVEDCWHPTYAGAPSDGSARTAPYRGKCHPEVRGGGAHGAPENSRAANRDFTANPTVDVGFRIARDLFAE